MPSEITRTLTKTNILSLLSGKIDTSGGILSGPLTLPADPTSNLQAATKQYVDAARSGLDVKLSVRVATTANITLSGTQTIDGISVIAGNRVLVKNQTTASQNGIYDVASGAWSRSSDADTSPEVTAGIFTFVEEGTANGDTGWVLATDNPITLGTTSLLFTQFNSAAQSSGIGSLNGVTPNTPGGNVSLAAGTGITVTPNDAADTITLASSGSAPTGAAGGDLSGTYPNPTVAALAITDAKVAAANKDGTGATPSLRTLGTGAAQAAAGNDARLSDARTPLAHNHAATEITSGTLATARLGSGTADATTFLRGDNTWAVPSGGGGGATNGAFNAPTSVSTSYTALTADYAILANATSGTLTVSLPTAVGKAGKEYVIKKVDSTANLVVIDPAGTETVDGLFTISTDTAQDVVTVQSDGANWRILSPPDAGGAGVDTVVRLASDVARSTTTYADLTGLSFVVSAGVVYNFHAQIIYNVNATTTGGNFSVNGPASPTMLAFNITRPSTTAPYPQTAVVTGANAYDSPGATSVTGTPATTGNLAEIRGIIQPSAGGTFAIRFASEIAVTNGVIAKAGSTLRYW